MSGVPYTEEQKKWLIDNFDKAENYEQLAIIFNGIFGSSRNEMSIRDLCNKRLKLKRPGNRGRYGTRQKERLPIGSIRKGQNGSTYIKVLENDEKYSGYQEPFWIPLQKKIYQDAYGPIPDGYMVCFLNHDPTDFRLENLYPITRKTACRLAWNKWWSEDPDITKAAIKLCELNEAIKDLMEA